MPAAVLRQKAAGPGLGGGGRRASGQLLLLGRRQAGGRRHRALDLAAAATRPRPRSSSALERGDNPLATFPTLLQFSWDTISQFGLAFNFFVLGAQLLAPLAILRVRWLLFFTLLFDVFHIGVYMTLGALFHFWIAVNLIVYTSAWRLKDNQITPMMKLVCIAATLFGHTIFYTNFLGWLDGASWPARSSTP